MTGLIHQPAQLPSVEDVTEDLHLIARDAGEMQVAQQRLVNWFRSKIEILHRDLDEVDELIDAATRGNFKLTGLNRQHLKVRKRIAYYEKCRIACEAGYTIIPNMPMDIFAIRTDKRVPKGNWGGSQQEQHPEGLPAEEGRYVGPWPGECYEREVTRTRSYGDKPEYQITEYLPANFEEDIEFPVSIARPEIMDSTAAAMALKAFDKIGVVQERRGDPIVIGQVQDTQFPSWRGRGVSFLVSWYVDTRTL